MLLFTDIDDEDKKKNISIKKDQQDKSKLAVDSLHYYKFKLFVFNEKLIAIESEWREREGENRSDNQVIDIPLSFNVISTHRSRNEGGTVFPSCK